MRNVASLGLTLLLWTPLALSAGEEAGLPEGQSRAVIPVSGMICGDCCLKVETAVAMIDGVVGVKADYKKGVATVTHVKDRVDVKQIVETINTKTGFKARAPKDTIFNFTDWPLEFGDHPTQMTPLKAPEEEKFRFADWVNPTGESSEARSVMASATTGTAVGGSFRAVVVGGIGAAADAGLIRKAVATNRATMR